MVLPSASSSVGRPRWGGGGRGIGAVGETGYLADFAGQMRPSHQGWRDWKDGIFDFGWMKIHGRVISLLSPALGPAGISFSCMLEITCFFGVRWCV